MDNTHELKHKKNAETQNVATAKLKGFNLNMDITVDMIQQRCKRVSATMYLRLDPKRHSPAEVICRFFQEVGHALTFIPENETFAAILPGELFTIDGQFAQELVMARLTYLSDTKELFATRLEDGSQFPAKEAKVFSMKYP